MKMENNYKGQLLKMNQLSRKIVDFRNYKINSKTNRFVTTDSRKLEKGRVKNHHFQTLDSKSIEFNNLYIIRTSRRTNKIFLIISISWIILLTSVLSFTIIWSRNSLESGYKCYSRSPQNYLGNLLENDTCTVTNQCYLGLSCQGGVCKCNESIQYWNGSKCVNLLTYNQGTCENDNLCKGNLLCKTLASSNCSCPVAMPVNKCDCVREYNNEYYWNGVTCVNARGYNQTCTNSSSTYMCKTLTEGTVCIGPYPYRCKCKTLQYFNNDQNYCLDQVSESGLCTQKDACRIDLGLSCQGGVCKCNGSIQYWNGLKCVNLLTYNQGTCANDNQCKGNLICKTSGSCNCPLNVVSNHCDCPNRVSGSEYYWNGYDCVLAGVYGQSCNSANYSCQYLTQKTQCDGSTLKCTCGPSGAWNGATCVFCDNGWYSVRGSCFKAISIPANVNTPSQIVSLCGNSNARLAILYRIDLSWLVYLSYTEQNNYFDSSYNFTSASPKCNVFDNSILNFDIHGCLHAHGMICEYVLYNNP